VWSYITDLPYPPTAANSSERSDVDEIARAVSTMVAQTDEARSYLETIAPASAGKTVLMPPIIPARHAREKGDRSSDGVVRVCYAGKFAQGWMTRELLELPRALARLGVESELWMIGDKFQGSASVPDWPDRMRSELLAADADPLSGVRYLGALARSEAIDMMSLCDFGMSWRSEELDSSLELSTKVLEYLSAGTVPLVNRSRANRDLLGDSYAAFLPDRSRVDGVAATIARLVTDSEHADLVSSDLVRRFTAEAAADRLRSQLSGIRPASANGQRARPTRLTFACHDAKFLGEIRRSFAADSGFEVADDQWRTLHVNDEESSNRALAWSDVIFCEWAGPNLAFYSQHKHSGQRLVCRFHGFEINGPWMLKVDFDAVDHISFVSEHHRSLAIERFGLEEARTSVISNAIDADDLARPKLSGSERRIGLLGYVPFLKRPDRALDLLDVLLERDPAYTLHVKGRPPWEYPHVWNDPLERQLYLEFFARVRSSHRLRESVVFEPFSPAVGNWLRKIGVIVSPSDRETFHLAAAEGMASGSVPVVWDRPGAPEIFGSDLVNRELESIAAQVLELRDDDVRAETASNMRHRAEQWSAQQVADQWKDVVVSRR